MVTARQKLLVRNSWELMRPMAIHVADLFYDRLYELDPSLEEVFPEDVSVQRPRFMTAVGAAVSGLDDVERMRSLLSDLGRRHLSQGIKPGHYVTFGKALLWTFEQSLADAFTPPVKDAWAALHAFVSAVMAQGAEACDVFKPREQAQLAV
jgi:hemoglobin-like flavoprotein